MEVILKARSSSGDFYNVLFLFKDEGLSVKCNCKAGIFGQLCKHKIALISGDISLLYEKSQIDQFNNLQELLKETKIKSLASQLHSINIAIEEKKKEENRIKKLIEKELK